MVLDRFFGPKESKYPTKNRSCTDLLCAIIFALFLSASVVAACYGLMKGDISNIAQPYDSDGLACGKGKAKKHPFLYSNKPLSTNYVKETVCVTECPKKNTKSINCIPNTDVPK